MQIYRQKTCVCQKKAVLLRHEAKNITHFDVAGHRFGTDVAEHGTLDGDNGRESDDRVAQVVAMSANDRYVPVAADSLRMDLGRAPQAVLVAEDGPESRRLVFCAVDRYHGVRRTGYQPVSGFERPYRVTGLYERNRAEDAGDGRQCGAADRAVFAGRPCGNAAHQYRPDGVAARFRGGVIVPRHVAADIRGQESRIKNQDSFSYLGNGICVFSDSYAVLRVCAAYADGRDVRIYIRVDGKSMGTHCDAFYE